jgi:hypothetical protein
VAGRCDRFANDTVNRGRDAQSPDLLPAAQNHARNADDAKIGSIFTQIVHVTRIRVLNSDMPQ